MRKQQCSQRSVQDFGPSPPLGGVKAGGTAHRRGSTHAGACLSAAGSHLRHTVGDSLQASPPSWSDGAAKGDGSLSDPGGARSPTRLCARRYPPGTRRRWRRGRMPRSPRASESQGLSPISRGGVPCRFGGIFGGKALRSVPSGYAPGQHRLSGKKIRAESLDSAV